MGAGAGGNGGGGCAAAGGGMRDTLIAVFGSKLMDTLEPLAFEVPELGVRVSG